MNYVLSRLISWAPNNTMNIEGVLCFWGGTDRTARGRGAQCICVFSLTLLNSVSEQLSGVHVLILFLFSFLAFAFQRSLCFSSLLFTAVSQFWDFWVPPEGRPLIFVLSSPGHRYIARSDYFSCIVSHHFVRCSSIVHSRRCFLTVGRRNVWSNTLDDALFSNVAIPGWLITIRSSETYISSKSWPLLSSGPPLHDLDLALKSSATMMGPGHCLMLPSKSSKSSWNISSDAFGE